MGSRNTQVIAKATLVLRLITLLALVASVVVMATNKFTTSDGNKTTFKDLIAYRYALAVASIGGAYSLVQMPFALYYASTQKRLIKSDFLPLFDFYGDKIMSLLLGTGVGAAFAVTLEFNKFLNDLLETLISLGVTEAGDLENEADKYFDKANISTALLFVAFICMSLLSVFSSLNRSSAKANGLFG